MKEEVRCKQQLSCKNFVANAEYSNIRIQHFDFYYVDSNMQLSIEYYYTEFALRLKISRQECVRIGKCFSG